MAGLARPAAAGAGHERVLIRAVVKGDAHLVRQAAKEWLVAEPGNEVAKWFFQGTSYTLACGHERCGVNLPLDPPDAAQKWLKAREMDFPGNPHLAMLSVGAGCADLDCRAAQFKKALAMKGSSLDFNFTVALCSYWVEQDVTSRLRKDWRERKSVPTALRLAQRLSCCNDDFCATREQGQEATGVLNAAASLEPGSAPIRDALNWAAARSAP